MAHAVGTTANCPWTLPTKHTPATTGGGCEPTGRGCELGEGLAARAREGPEWEESAPTTQRMRCLPRRIAVRHTDCGLEGTIHKLIVVLEDAHV